MICPNCHIDIQDDSAQFCPNCGAKLAVAVAAQPAPVIAPAEPSQPFAAPVNTYQPTPAAPVDSAPVQPAPAAPVQPAFNQNSAFAPQPGMPAQQPFLGAPAQPMYPGMPQQMYPGAPVPATAPAAPKKKKKGLIIGIIIAAIILIAAGVGAYFLFGGTSTKASPMVFINANDELVMIESLGKTQAKTVTIDSNCSYDYFFYKNEQYIVYGKQADTDDDDRKYDVYIKDLKKDTAPMLLASAVDDLIYDEDIVEAPGIYYIANNTLYQTDENNHTESLAYGVTYGYIDEAGKHIMTEQYEDEKTTIQFVDLSSKTATTLSSAADEYYYDFFAKEFDGTAYVIESDTLYRVNAKGEKQFVADDVESAQITKDGNIYYCILDKTYSYSDLVNNDLLYDDDDYYSYSEESDVEDWLEDTYKSYSLYYYDKTKSDLVLNEVAYDYPSRVNQNTGYDNITDMVTIEYYGKITKTDLSDLNDSDNYYDVFEKNIIKETAVIKGAEVMRLPCADRGLRISNIEQIDSSLYVSARSRSDNDNYLSDVYTIDFNKSNSFSNAVLVQSNVADIYCVNKSPVYLCSSSSYDNSSSNYYLTINGEKYENINPSICTNKDHTALYFATGYRYSNSSFNSDLSLYEYRNGKVGCIAEQGGYLGFSDENGHYIIIQNYRFSSDESSFTIACKSGDQEYVIADGAKNFNWNGLDW